MNRSPDDPLSANRLIFYMASAIPPIIFIICFPIVRAKPPSTAWIISEIPGGMEVALRTVLFVNPVLIGIGIVSAIVVTRRGGNPLFLWLATSISMLPFIALPFIALVLVLLFGRGYSTAVYPPCPAHDLPQFHDCSSGHGGYTA